MIKSLKVALVQHSNTNNLDNNFKKTIQGIQQAAAENAQLIVLQELHRSLYFCQTEDVSCFDLAETIPGSSTELLGQLAQELGVVIVASLFEKRATGLYHNTAVVLDKDGEIAGKYRKMHIPDDPGFYEKFYFTPGDLGFEPINTSIGRLGVMVCWDQWFPEGARLMAMKGAQMLIYPTAIGWDPRDSQDEKIRQRDAWMIAQRAHAVSNGIPVISCNRVGYEADPSSQSEGIVFWGNSFITGSQGEILAHASENQEEVLTGIVDLERSENVRRIWPYLRDRRIDHYQDLLKIYRD
ncbi:Nitrilase/cyanide hydratase and apolipoprotein N-acyltransferase [Rippkaea orientalis PCC 8801]|uniref:Nitrilase/cyanide hydratase and apolipoprotein N-acyltransferase n=1 Tax=Rippkaea orientalis (strain PCC 8801 / RF-1) TaxID=41431 RepID=B7JZW8_RIPO1|nr:carbon-nitrogen hydrolase [Rippkaea orientalis]ACK65061.1 Nitrilase/cyanide hydratase and apolipoprotein N-acyltransferase [Rippkaea orientalis PCC 8801]